MSLAKEIRDQMRTFGAHLDFDFRSSSLLTANIPLSTFTARCCPRLLHYECPVMRFRVYQLLVLTFTRLAVADPFALSPTKRHLHQPSPGAKSTSRLDGNLLCAAHNRHVENAYSGATKLTLHRM